MQNPSEKFKRLSLHFVFSELPLIALDHRSPRFMAGLRFVVGVIVASLAIAFLADGLWWGLVLVAPVAGLAWTGHVDLELARADGEPSSLTLH
jgi:hypothetical protein